jgi:hypothetical protein
MRLRAALEADAANPSGRTSRRSRTRWPISAASWPRTRARGTAEPRGGARAGRAAAECRAQLADFIAGVVRGWDTATVTEKIELRVGKDLQYVRINGTLVGFLVGGVLFAVLTALFGRVAV